MRTLLMLPLIVLVSAGLLRAADSGAVVNPLVTTDRSIDTSTADTILAGLIRKDMTDEQKVLAVFNWVRRMLYHGDGPVQYAYNFHNMIGIFGNGSCLRQTTPMWVLLDRLGYKCRTGAVGGHHIIEVQYGGAWHLFDPHTTFYVYDRATPRAIASIEQIKADPTLVSDAVREGRACPGFLLCGDGIGMFTDPKAWKVFGDFPESRKYTPVIEEPFGRIKLPRGTTYIRTWMPGQYWFKPNWYKKDEGPRHGCGIRCDAKDTVNLPFYEPHAAGSAYRHWGAGRLVYTPDLTSDHYTDAVASQSNVKPVAGKGLTAVDPGQAAEVVFRVDCPYVITAAHLSVKTTAPIEAAVSVDAGKSWTPVLLEGEQTGGREGMAFNQATGPMAGTLSGYQLKLTWKGDQPLRSLGLTSHFQLNPYALPCLLPGRNIVNVAGERFGSPLTVQWNYAEGPKWDKETSASKTFDKPGTFEIVVEEKSGKHPRNVELTLTVAP
ncbi:MAG: hypothetical protein BIFFINMI_00015 [Phycisphaerae bacterium]|nr:hypothetical protein [Phycisphaerae bacterium]